MFRGTKYTAKTSNLMLLKLGFDFHLGIYVLKYQTVYVPSKNYQATHKEITWSDLLAHVASLVPQMTAHA